MTMRKLMVLKHTMSIASGLVMPVEERAVRLVCADWRLLYSVSYSEKSPAALHCPHCRLDADVCLQDDQLAGTARAMVDAGRLCGGAADHRCEAAVRGAC